MAVFRILLAVAVTLGRLLPFLIVAAALFLLWRRSRTRRDDRWPSGGEARTLGSGIPPRDG